MTAIAPSFDHRGLVASCLSALGAPRPLDALSSAVEAALADLPATFDPARNALRLTVLHEAPELTILQLILPGGFVFPPHDHHMLSVVGVYAGVEDNVYYERQGSGLVEVGRRRLCPGEVAAHDQRVIHAIANTESDLLAAVHVYAGDFFRVARSEWRGDPLEEGDYDLVRLRQLADRG